jgi:DNA polymerase elongation subunit (family B)
MTKKDLLYGVDDEERLVGLHAEGDDKIRLYTRTEDDTVTSRTEEFVPFGHFTRQAANALSEGYNVRQIDVLSGPGEKDRLVTFDTQKQFWSARGWLSQQVEGEEYDMNPSLTTQYLQKSGKTLFGGMKMDDVLRMQIDLEVQAPRGQFPNAEREEDEIIIVSITTNRDRQFIIHQAPPNGSITGQDGYDTSTNRQVGGEKELIREVVKIVHRYDPDVLEFHNGLGFDLPYLHERAEMHGVNLALGRDNKEPKRFASKKQFAEREQEYTNFLVAGRSVIDSYFLAADFDVFARDLPSYGLKDLASYFGFAKEDRTYVEGENITDVWGSDPMRLIDYALDDAVETRKLVEKLGTSTFELAKILPANYQEVMTLGTAGSIEIMMKRTYIHRGEAIPKPEEPDPPAGGYTEVFRRGTYENLAYADVSSLYPSNMIIYGVEPDSDSLGVFRPLLKLLTDLRLKAKKKMRGMEDSPEKDTLDAKQQAFKVLINSFYGALGFAFFAWNDYDDAALVTRKGRKILKRLIHEIEDRGGTTVLCDSVTADTPIYTKDDKGRLNITSIASLHGCNLKRRGSNGLKVLTGGGWKKYSYTYRHETDKEIVQTSTYDSTIQTTRDHSLMSDGQEISPDDMSKGSKIDHNRPELPEAEEGSPEDYRRGFFWGAMCGDGSASRVTRKEGDKSNWSTNVSFHNQNKNLHETIQTIAESHFGISMTLYDTSESSNTMRLTGGNNKEEYEFVARKIYDKATGEKKVPMCVLNGSEEMRKGFLDGYFATDGYENGYGRRFTTKSHILAAGVWMLLQEYNSDVNVGDRSDKKNVLRLVEVQNSRTEKKKVRSQRNRGKCERAVYDISTEDDTFVAGVGGIVAHNTDGVMFELPGDMTDKEVDAFIGEEISEVMPPGIDIDNDGRFERVVSYKRKNYAKIPRGGTLTDIQLKGNSLIGRGMEQFLRQYIQHQMKALAAKDVARMAEIHSRLKTAIMGRELSPDQFKKRGRLKMTMDEYAESPSNLARYEVAAEWQERTGKEAKAGDTFWYYVSGSDKNPTVFQAAKLIEDYDGDENRHYLMQRLDDTADIFRSMVTEPSKVFSMEASAPGQNSLFGNTPNVEGVEVVSGQVRPLPDNPTDDEIKPSHKPN